MVLDLGKNHSWWAIGKWIHFLWKFMFPQGTHSGEWEVKIVMQPARDGEKQPPNWWVFSRRTKANWKSSGDDSNGISDKLISNWLVLYCEDSILHLFICCFFFTFSLKGTSSHNMLFLLICTTDLNTIAKAYACMANYELWTMNQVIL